MTTQKTFPEIDRREPCQFHGQVKSLSKEFYAFQKDQIRRNEACDLQLAQHDRDITRMKDHSDECRQKTLPGIRKNNVRAVTGLSMVGVFFTILLVYVNSIADAVSETKPYERMVIEMKADMKHMSENITGIRKVQESYATEEREQSKLMMEILKRLPEAN